MHVRRIQLHCFRNYQELDLSLEPGRLLFLGDNAQGKTNLLEAVYLLAAGRSPRAGNDAELISWPDAAEGQPFARLAAAIERQHGAVSLESLIVGAGRGPEAKRAGKRFRVNGIPRRSIDFVGQLRAVLFTADDLEIVSGAPAARRQYLDATLSQFDRAYHACFLRYGRVLQQRNATLRRIREGIAGPDELSLWDESFGRDASQLIAARVRALVRLGVLAAGAHAELSGVAREELSLAYEPALGDDWRRLLPAADPELTAAAVEPLFGAALASQRRRETAAGLSLLGPHRDDITIRLNGVAAAAFASRAQVRTAALSLRLAEARLLAKEGGEAPVVLLDDIVSELDERRRDSVLAGLSGFDQVWLTATTGSGLPADFLTTCRRFLVQQGSVAEG